MTLLFLNGPQLQTKIQAVDRVSAMRGYRSKVSCRSSNKEVFVLSIAEILPEMIATIVGVAIGGMGALYNNRRQSNAFKRNRAKILLKNIDTELKETFKTITDAKQVFEEARYGKSFYLSSIAWDTATKGGDLAHVIGVELADVVENQYSVCFRLRYYVDLMTQLWLAPMEIEGRVAIQEGFRKQILLDLDAWLGRYPEVHRAVCKEIESLSK